MSGLCSFFQDHLPPGVAAAAGASASGITSTIDASYSASLAHDNVLENEDPPHPDQMNEEEEEESGRDRSTSLVALSTVEFTEEKLNFDEWKQVRNRWLQDCIERRILPPIDDDYEKEGGGGDGDMDDYGSRVTTNASDMEIDDVVVDATAVTNAAQQGPNHERQDADGNDNLETQDLGALYPLGSDSRIDEASALNSMNKNDPLHITHVDDTTNTVHYLADLEYDQTKELNLNVLRVEKIWTSRMTRRYPVKSSASRRQAVFGAMGKLPRVCLGSCEDDGPLSTCYQKVLSLEVVQLQPPEIQDGSELRRRIENVQQEGDLNSVKVAKRLVIYFYNSYASKIQELLFAKNRSSTDTTTTHKNRTKCYYLSLQGVPAKCIFPMPPSDWFDAHDMSECCLVIGDESKMSVEIPGDDMECSEAGSQSRALRFDDPKMSVTIGWQQNESPGGAADNKAPEALATETFVSNFPVTEVTLEASPDDQPGIQLRVSGDINKQLEDDTDNDKYGPIARYLVAVSNVAKLLFVPTLAEPALPRQDSIVTNRVAAPNSGTVGTYQEVRDRVLDGLAVATNIQVAEDVADASSADAATNKATVANDEMDLVEGYTGERSCEHSSESRKNIAEEEPLPTSFDQEATISEDVRPSGEEQLPMAPSHDRVSRPGPNGRGTQPIATIRRTEALRLQTLGSPSRKRKLDTINYVVLNELTSVFESHKSLAMESSEEAGVCEVNLYAVVLGFGSPSLSKRGDWTMSVALVDDSQPVPYVTSNGTSSLPVVGINIFTKEKSQLPQIMCAGDVLRMHRVKLQKWKDEMQLMGMRKSSYIVFRGNTEDPTAPANLEVFTWNLEGTHFSNADKERPQELWKWGYHRLSAYPTMKVTQRLTLGDLPLQLDDNAQIGTSNISTGDVTIMVCAIIPIPPYRTSGVTPVGFLRIWDGTGVSVSDPLPQYNVGYAIENGDPPTEAVQRIASIIKELRYARKDDTLEPPVTLCGRVVNVAVWEASHWDLITTAAKVGSFARLRNVKLGALPGSNQSFIFVHSKSYFTPLPDRTYEVGQMLDQHRIRIDRKEIPNPHSGFLPIDTNQDVPTRTQQSVPLEDARGTVDKEILPEEPDKGEQEVSPWTKLRLLRAAPLYSVFRGTVRISGLIPSVGVISADGITQICVSERSSNNHVYQFAISLDDGSAQVDAIASNVVGEKIVGMPAPTALSNKHDALFNMRMVLRGKVSVDC